MSKKLADRAFWMKKCCHEFLVKKKDLKTIQSQYFKRSQKSVVWVMEMGINQIRIMFKAFMKEEEEYVYKMWLEAARLED